MLCSVMIPSRKGGQRLFATLSSILKAADTIQDYEVLVRLDDDDAASLASVSLLEAAGVRVFVGPRLGYANLDTGYYAGLEQEAKGQWVWIAGDDLEVTGDWLGELRKVPTHGYIVQPEISKLGGSTYHRAEAQGFPIFPRFCWKQYANTFPKPFDTQGDLLLKQNGWQTWFLPGVCMWHRQEVAGGEYWGKEGR